MHGTSSDFSLRSAFPRQPVLWLWSRTKVYLLVLAVVTWSFFFVASWLGASPQGEARLFSSEGLALLGMMTPLVVGLASSVLRYRRYHRHF